MVQATVKKFTVDSFMMMGCHVISSAVGTTAIVCAVFGQQAAVPGAILGALFGVWYDIKYR
jgi:energy-converting hydrogenase Eha subunit A